MALYYSSLQNTTYTYYSIFTESRIHLVPNRFLECGDLLLLEMSA